MSRDVIRLYTLPKPTLEDPHAQIKWIFFQVGSEFKEPTAARFRYAKNKYIDFVVQTNAYYPELESNRRFYLERYWDVDALIRFNKWLLTQELASKTRYSIYKSVRQVMDMTYALRIIDTIVYHAPMFKGVSETKQRSSYAKREQEVINGAVAKWIGLAISVLRGYTPTGKGVPYRRKDYLPPINIEGRYYTIGAAAKVFGVEHGVITQRLTQGWTSRQAVGLDPSSRTPALNWVIDGEVFPTKEAIARKFGISTSVIGYRAKKGWTPEQIVGLAAKPERDFSAVTGKPKQAVVDGIVFKSIKDACNHFGIGYGMAKQRLTQGWSLRQALELETHAPYGTKVTVEGVTYHSISAAAKKYRVNDGIVSLRLRKGHTPEQAVGIEPITVHRSDDRALLWMFENLYACDAYAMREDFQKRRRQLSGTCSEKRLLRLFAHWGVWPHIDDRLVMPLAVEMAMLTGLNVESLKLLEIDSFQLKHRLTGQPVIYYNKTRSGNATRSEDRELHLHVLELEELYLEDSVVERIGRLWNLVLGITARIRGKAPPELSRRLFIFEDVELSRKREERVIVPIDPTRKTSTWYARFSREEGLYDIFGDKFNFNIARCRPTLATNMVLAGSDFFQVQVVLGHQNAQTTLTYLDEHQLRPAFHKTIAEALEGISRRSRNLLNNSKASHRCSFEEDDGGKYGFHETLSGCGCANPYQPSEHVRALTKFQAGAVCKYWNMCLLCDNSVITEKSLPKLILYRDRVATALEEDSPAIKARKELYQDVLKLIEDTLVSDVIFPAQVIRNAERIAATMDDLLVDQLVYQGV